MVGSRRATSYGVDSCARRGALDEGRKIAVLGCGPDLAYPAAYRSLWRRISERDLVSGRS